jgi:hypothetical protein
LTRGGAENLFSVLAIWNPHFAPLLFFSLADVIFHIHMQALKRANQPNSQSSDPTADVQVNPTKGPRTKGLEHYGVVWGGNRSNLE